MQLKFLQKFKRVTYSTSYLPEVDGLRFLAIFLVVVIMHIPNYLNEKFYNHQLIPAGYWKNFVMAGGHGVALFFVISGFILSLPFAKWRLNNGKKISLKNYYLRRVTRLEPPYFIALIIFFIANVFVLHAYSFKHLLPHFFASMAYLHTVIYQSFSPVLPVAWSLEIEVQFYVLAPLFFLIYTISSNAVRRSIFLLVIVAGSYYWFDYWGIGNVFTFSSLFFIGLLLTDLYCTNTILIKNKFLNTAVGIASLTGFLFIPSIYHEVETIHYSYSYYIKLLCIFFMFHTVLHNANMKKLFSKEIVIIIGGMCYSIYLLHFAIISATGTLLMKTGIKLDNKLYSAFYLLLLIFLVLVISSLYFLFVEKPFMKPVSLLKKSR